MSAKSLIKTQKYQFSKTICVIAGGPHMDLVGSNIIKAIKQASPDTKFIGIGGQKMQDNGLEKNYADVNKFLNKPLYPYKNFKHKHIERPVHPVYGFYHHANRQVRDQIDKSEFFKDIVQIKPDAFLCLQNDFFMNRVYNFLNDLYDNNHLVKPPVFHYDRTHVNQRQEFTNWLDHQFSVNPMKPLNYGRYTFPSTVVGHEGVGRAWQYLYSRNEKFSSLATDEHIYISPEHNKQIIETLVLEERTRFRQQAGLKESQHLIFISPGNVQKELDFSIKALKNGINEYLQRPEVQNIDKSHIVLVVCLPEDSFAAQIESAFKGLNIPLQTVFTTNKYSAMAGSDCGLVHNGEIVSECAAMQLPVAILERMPYPQAHFMQLYNHWNNELNIAANGEVQQELVCTTATPYRISEELSNMSDPKMKYYVANRLQHIVYEMVPKAYNDDKALTVDNKYFVKHTYTYQTIANKILTAANAYNTSDKNIPHYKINQFREELIAKSL